MAGRFAHALRTGQRGVAPRRARNIVLFAAAVFCVALVLISSRSLIVNVPHLDATSVHRATGVEKAAAATAATAATTPSKRATAKIVTCPACRLNALPKVKVFVYTHAKNFAPALVVDLIVGEDPRLHLYSGGVEVEDIDLAEYDTTKIIKKLYDFGIRPVTVTPAVKEALGPRPLLQTAPPKGGA